MPSAPFDRDMRSVWGRGTWEAWRHVVTDVLMAVVLETGAVSSNNEAEL